MNFLTFIISLVIMIAVSEVGSSLILEKSYPYFYFGGVENELPSNLYGKLDPLLGYTFNRDVKVNTWESKHHPTLDKNWKHEFGYIFFEYGLESTQKKPLRVLIYGGSATDSNIFHGNWPYFLHLALKDKEVPHTIINGAVSGYSSNQEVIKFQRDLNSFDDIDVVIAYNGVNDTLANEDILKDYPWVHPYQESLYKRLSGSQVEHVRSTVLPNLRALISRALSVQRREVSYGKPYSKYEARYLFNKETMKALCDLRQIKFLHVLQPIAWSEKQRGKGFVDSRGSQFLKSIKPFYSQIKKGLPEYSFDLDERLRERNNGFIDYVHLSKSGNKVVATEILNEVTIRLNL